MVSPPPSVIDPSPLFTPGGLVLGIIGIIVGAIGLWLRERKDRPTVKRQAEQIQSLETRAETAEGRANTAATKADNLEIEVAKLGGALKQQYDFAQAIEVLKSLTVAVRDSIGSARQDRSVLSERMTEHARATYEEHGGMIATLKELINAQRESTTILAGIRDHIEKHNGWDQKTERRK